VSAKVGKGLHPGLRQGFAGANSSLGRRSFSEGGKEGGKSEGMLRAKRL
jgi:hypothetical protein